MYAALLNKQLVLAATEAAQIKNKARKNYSCPRCHQRVQLIKTAQGAYFKHLTRSTNMMGEKEEHALSKFLLKEALREAGFHAQLEIPLAKGQLRADVLANSQLAFEVQCAPLSLAEFNHRHQLYSEIGAVDVWVVGRRHYLQRQIKKSQLIFFRKNQLWHDYYLEINPKRRQLILKYNVLLEPVTSRVHYQMMTFALSAQGLRHLWYFRPQLKAYQVNSAAQRRYLARQLMQKTKTGQSIATALYVKKMTLDDLPEKVFTEMRHVDQLNNVLAYLN
ncbi:competence protein CoiA family protein [Lactobacillus sp. ESL0731]|uniref:competence protein CoiA family protein n=1 Tax=unclassified Lactobacillus TaxID=2620435 RepID=UPI0023F623F7|nr:MULTISPECIES: competence protein CoiA family protein [unclassified Lactobacillus]WEV51723.1 competence protein CoiA family protein [Lactobacillus sp. ESL0700]WEV62852.1 competence protein CoiA family protein [Lactobacillus sp. ESL0731]